MNIETRIKLPCTGGSVTIKSTNPFVAPLINPNMLNTSFDITAIRAQLRTQLADYKVPKHVEIQANLPREDSGKIFKRRLRDPYWERAGRRI